ncbi:MAG: glycosyltransferase family 4 protein [Alteraurantiacibacter sp.]
MNTAASDTRQPMIWLFSDILAGLGGIETYLDALARKLDAEGRPFKIAVSLNGPTPILDDLEALGILVYRQKRVPGDRFHIRQRLLIRYVASQLEPGDWVYCIRQPMPEIYLSLVKAVHARGAKIAASWIFSPQYIPPPQGRLGKAFCQAVQQTDAVISVSECGKGEFVQVYGYAGAVNVVRYHNRPLFEDAVALPPMPPFQVGYAGRIDIRQKNLDTLLEAFALLCETRPDSMLNLHGGGPDEATLKDMVAASPVAAKIRVHGRYDLASDMAAIVAQNHVFTYASRFEGGPCFSLLELMQAGRYVVASPVGGIPDLYEGHREAGALVDFQSPADIASALEQAARLIEQGGIDVKQIRRRYLDEFTGDHAHRQFLDALGLERLGG